jgi:type II secretory pathway pseudopilin PulG
MIANEKTMTVRITFLRPMKRRTKQDGWSLLELSFSVLIIGVISAIAIPQFLMYRSDAKTFGDSRDLTDLILLAKMRAAANFTQARLYADTSAKAFHVEIWNKTGATWQVDGGVNPLATGNTFSFGSLTSPPTGTQSSIGLAPACQALAGGTGTISNTSCIVFNSRGIPVDSTGAPTANDALYVTDGNTVYAMTVSATGLLQLWSSSSNAASWRKR